MTIKREVNGKMMEFKLTWQEWVQAYTEYEHAIDKETVDFYFDDLPDDKIDEIADRYRAHYNSYLDEDADPRFECAQDAIREVLGDDYLENY